MRKRLIVNSISGGAQLLIATLLLLITIPVFIQKLGIEVYGVFSLILVINNFSFFFGLGINSSLIKFISEQGRTKETTIDIYVAYIVLLLLLLPVTIICLLYNYYIVEDILNIPAKFINSDTLVFFNFLLGANFFQFLAQISVSVLDSVQKIYLSNLYQAIYQILYWLLIILSIYLFGSLKMIGISIFISTIIWFILLLGSSKKYYGNVNLVELKSHFVYSLRKQVSFSYKLYISNLVNFFYEPLTKILISSFLGISYVGVFDIILRVRTLIWNFIIKLLYPLFPFISQLKDKSIVRNLIHDIEQKLTYVIFFLIGALIFVIPDFVEIWLTNGTSVNIAGLILIVSTNLIAFIAMPMYQFLTLKGYEEKTITLQLLNVVVNLLIFFVFYKIIGFWAVILGNMSAIISSFLLSLFYQKKFLNSLIFDNFRQLLKAVLLFLLILLFGWTLDILLNGIVEIFMLPLILGLVTVIFIRFLKLITIQDILKYSGKNKKIQNILEKIFIMSKGTTAL